LLLLPLSDAGCLLTNSAPGDLISAQFSGGLGSVAVGWDHTEAVVAGGPLRRGAYDKAFLPPRGPDGHVTSK